MSEILTTLHKDLDERKFTDYEFVFNDEHIAAHKNILASASKVFADAFDSTLTDSKMMMDRKKYSPVIFHKFLE